jgi:transposase
MWTHENRPKYNRDHLRYPSDLTDDEWAYVEPLIPPAKPGGGKRRTDMRAFARCGHIIWGLQWGRNVSTSSMGWAGRANTRSGN